MPPGSIAAVKRISAGLLAVLAVLATGAATSACTVSPVAASVNGDTISVSSLNTQLDALSQTTAGQCLLSLKFPDSVSLATQGTGGTGTYSTDYASTILGTSVYNLLAVQYAEAHGLHVTAADLDAAESAYESTLSGAIQSQAQQDSSLGGTSSCAESSGTLLTGEQVLAGLPGEVRDVEITNQAVETLLLARGADLSDAAILGYYVANPTDFTLDCVGVIVVASQATADTVYNQLNAGASFASLAASTSIDAKTAESGGQLGCNFPESEVVQSLQVSSVTVGKAVTPEVTSSGDWEIFEVTSGTLLPVTEVTSEIREELLETTANRDRISNEVLAFSKHASIDINPQYGSWTRAQIVPPATPPAKYLLPSYASPSSGATKSTGSGSASTGSGGASTGSGSASTGSGSSSTGSGAG